MTDSTDPEEQDLYALVNRGLALYHSGEFFEAHEVWEHAWGAEVGRTKLTLQAIIQVAAAMLKHREGNARGTSKLFAKAKDKVAEIREGASSWLGIDLVRLSDDIDRALREADAIASGDTRSIAPPHLPDRTGRDGILYLHGFASGPSSAKARLMVPPFREKGYHVDVPDQNEGDFRRLTITRALALAKRFIRERTLIIGSSLGGYIAALIAAKDDRVKGLVLMAPAFDLAKRLRARYGEEGMALWRSRGSVEVEHYAFGGKHAIDYGFVADAETHPGEPAIRVPTYILQGRRDDTVDPAVVESVAQRYAAFVELDLVDDGHALTDTADRALRAALEMAARLEIEPE